MRLNSYNIWLYIPVSSYLYRTLTGKHQISDPFRSKVFAQRRLTQKVSL